MAPGLRKHIDREIINYQNRIKLVFERVISQVIGQAVLKCFSYASLSVFKLGKEFDLKGEKREYIFIYDFRSADLKIDYTLKPLSNSSVWPKLWATDIEQFFSNFNVHTNYLGALLRCTLK